MSPARPSPRPVSRWQKPVAVAVLLLPLAKIGWDAFHGGLGANPIEAVLNRLGFWTMVMLALALVPAPAHALLGLAWPQRLRRVVGGTAFAYALLHFLFYVGVDKFFDVLTTWSMCGPVMQLIPTQMRSGPIRLFRRSKKFRSNLWSIISTLKPALMSGSATYSSDRADATLNSTL